MSVVEDDADADNIDVDQGLHYFHHQHSLLMIIIIIIIIVVVALDVSEPKGMVARDEAMYALGKGLLFSISKCGLNAERIIKNLIVFIARYTAPFDFDQQCKWSKSVPKKSLLADVDDVQGIHTSIITAMSVIFIVIFR
jgi:hypothetical protein